MTKLQMSLVFEDGGVSNFTALTPAFVGVVPIALER